MTPQEYQQAAARTEMDYRALPLGGLTGGARLGFKLLHALLGMQGELGELTAHVEKWVYYQTAPLNRVHMKEELGDLLWYLALAVNALGLDLGEVMAANVRKLKVRFPERYARDRVPESARDRKSERSTMEGPTDAES